MNHFKYTKPKLNENCILIRECDEMPYIAQLNDELDELNWFTMSGYLDVCDSDKWTYLSDVIDDNPVPSLDSFMEHFLSAGYMDNVDSIIREFVGEYKKLRNGLETDKVQPNCKYCDKPTFRKELNINEPECMACYFRRTG